MKFLTYKYLTNTHETLEDYKYLDILSRRNIKCKRPDVYSSVKFLHIMELLVLILDKLLIQRKVNIFIVSK